MSFWALKLNLQVSLTDRHWHHHEQYVKWHLLSLFTCQHVVCVNVKVLFHKMEKLWSIMWLCVCVRQQWTTDGNENSFKPLTDEYINKERIKWLLRTNKLFKYVKKTKVWCMRVSNRLMILVGVFFTQTLWLIAGVSIKSNDTRA